MKTTSERVAELVAAAPPITAEQREAAVRALRRRDVDAHIRAVVDSAPPLTEAQRARLAALLTPAVHRG